METAADAKRSGQNDGASYENTHGSVPHRFFEFSRNYSQFQRDGGGTLDTVARKIEQSALREAAKPPFAAVCTLGIAGLPVLIGRSLQGLCGRALR
jgi:hypothetical protein